MKSHYKPIGLFFLCVLLLGTFYALYTGYRKTQLMRALSTSIQVNSLKDGDIRIADVDDIISSMREYSYEDSHSCNPEIYDCSDIPEPTTEELSAMYVKTGMPNSEYHYVGQTQLKSYLEVILDKSNASIVSVVDMGSTVEIEFVSSAKPKKNILLITDKKESNTIDMVLIGESVDK